MRKKRILWCSESPNINTGYGVYNRNVLSILARSGEFELAQLSSCTSDDFDYQHKYPWKIYPVEPAKNDERLMAIFDSNKGNAFGAWRFEETCLSFLPDIVVDNRDWWAVEYQRRSPFSKYFHSVNMPTVDSTPQQKQWTEYYDDSAAILTYSDWGGQALSDQMGKIDYHRVSPAAAECFIPLNKNLVKGSLGIDPSAVVFGFVGRNQKRKLFPQLIQAFDRLASEVNSYLICHTSYPDNGWDFNTLLKECNNPHRVLFSYKCACGAYELCPFQSVVRKCNYCKNISSTMCNVDKGLEDHELAHIYNCMDLYVQACSNEGFGMPAVEAAACGVPIAVTNYSATEDFVHKLDAIPLEPSSLPREVETGSNKATLTPDTIYEVIKSFASLPRDYMVAKGIKTRSLYDYHYGSYEFVANTWANVFRSLPIRDFSETWASPPKIHHPPQQPETFDNVDEASRWLILNVLDEPERLNTLFHARINRDLSMSFKRATTAGEYLHEATSAMSSNDKIDFNLLYANFCVRREFMNECETRRVNLWTGR